MAVVSSSPHFEALMSRLESRDATIGIVGLGYVGLPLALAAVDAGFRVLGFDINPARTAAINAAEQVISYIGADVMRRAVDSGRLEAYHRPRRACPNPTPS